MNNRVRVVNNTQGRKVIMFYNKTEVETLEELKTTSTGLTSEEAAKRLEQYGKNQLPKKKKDSVLKIFLNELKDPMIILLMFAILASFLANEVVDALAILFIILVDLIMGTYQENKANNTAEALENLVTAKSKVLRNGEIIQVESTELTVGDVVVLESGDKISADIRILNAHNLLIDESTLTGESIGVEKNTDVIEQNIILSERKNELNLNEDRANNLALYLKTKFARYLHSLAKSSQDATAKTYRFIPLMDFSEKLDDQALYTFFGLSEEEIDLIEESIMDM